MLSQYAIVVPDMFARYGGGQNGGGDKADVLMFALCSLAAAVDAPPQLKCTAAATFRRVKFDTAV